uniref:Uncharacterized protein n=1 Tax=Anguilla anguilla TaxID=7936 RepID=A0A0E9QXF2_ANGAN
MNFCALHLGYETCKCVCVCQMNRHHMLVCVRRYTHHIKDKF